MIIYKTTNIINGKFYVGKDINDNPNYFGSGVLLQKAMDKYGKENFIKEIIDTAETNEELNEKERYWITKLNAQGRDIGYNITCGGTGGDTYTNNPNYNNIIEKLKLRNHTDETKQNISKNNWQTKGNGGRSGKKWTNNHRLSVKRYYEEHPYPMQGKTHTEETKQKISKAKKGQPSPRNGVQLSAETKQKISESSIGKTVSDETKQKMSNAKKGKTKPTIKCPYCSIIGGVPQMKQWHFDNCKNK